jgi:ornithine carbamoyltransferase
MAAQDRGRRATSTLRHCISLAEFSPDELRGLILTAHRIKQDPARYANLMRGRWLLMLFQKSSTRTRLSFELGIGRLGGQAIWMDWNTSNFSISPIEYEARYAAGQVDLIMARLRLHQDLLALAQHSTVPVINGCDDRYHPCQALADLLTVYEAAGKFDGVTVSYVGIANNVSNALAVACSLTGVHLILVTPEVNPAAEDAALMERLMAQGAVERSLDLNGAARRSQFVYTDTWVDMEFFNEPSYQQEKERRIGLLQPYQLNRDTLRGSDPYILHDMPIHPGYEIAADLVDSPRSLIYAQAANRTYVQQALMLHLLGIAAE